MSFSPAGPVRASIAAGKSASLKECSPFLMSWSPTWSWASEAEECFWTEEMKSPSAVWLRANPSPGGEKGRLSAASESAGRCVAVSG